MCAVDWALVCQIVAAVAAALAAIGAFLSARETRRAANSQLVMSLFSTVNSLEHRRAMARVMFEQDATILEDQIWAQQQMARLPLDDALARVLMLVQTAHALHQMRLINDDIVRAILSEEEVRAMMAIQPRGSAASVPRTPLPKC